MSTEKIAAAGEHLLAASSRLLFSPPRLDDPTLYVWQLNETSTRYTFARAWPSEQTLHLQFAILAAVNACTSLVCALLIVSMARSSKVTANPFNIYVLLIVIPDFLASFLCAITCAMSAPMSEYYSEAMCGFQAFYLCWAFAANGWMNSMVIYQVHKLLRFSRIRKHYIPPTHRQVRIHGAVVYVYATFWAFIGAFNIPAIPLETHAGNGFACFAMEVDKASTIFYYLVFLPAILVIPICYFFYVMIDIWRRNLLPPLGRRRNLSLFLLRMIALYFTIWFPFLVVSLVGNFVQLSVWVKWAGALISHCQGIVTAVFCLTNPDIMEAFQATIRCRAPPTSDAGFSRPSLSQTSRTSGTQRSANIFRWIRRSSRNNSTAAAAASREGERSSTNASDSAHYFPGNKIEGRRTSCEDESDRLERCIDDPVDVNVVGTGENEDEQPNAVP